MKLYSMMMRGLMTVIALWAMLQTLRVWMWRT